MNTVVIFLKIPKGEEEAYKGQHLIHPVLQDETLCSTAISDNYDRLKTETKKGRVTCEKCKAIVEFCKKSS